MSAKVIYRTRGGVLVTIEARRKQRDRSGVLREKVSAFLLSGGFHGWLWLHLLTEVKP